MNLDGTRRVMETTSSETANHYLRFGWVLINQYLTEGTDDAPATVIFVLASIRRLEDTRQLTQLSDPALVNRYLELGWRLIEKFVTATGEDPKRHEVPQFILAWQSDDPPMYPEDVPSFQRKLDTTPPPDKQLY